MARSRIALVSCFSSPFSPMISSGFLYSASNLSMRLRSIAIGFPIVTLSMAVYTVQFIPSQVLPVPAPHLTDGRIRSIPFLGKGFQFEIGLLHRAGPINRLQVRSYGFALSPGQIGRASCRERV